jgi:hypothetical protein
MTALIRARFDVFPPVRPDRARVGKGGEARRRGRGVGGRDVHAVEQTPVGGVKGRPREHGVAPARVHLQAGYLGGNRGSAHGIVSRNQRVGFARVDAPIGVSILRPVRTSSTVGIGAERIGGRRGIQIGDEMAAGHVSRRRGGGDAALEPVGKAVVVRVVVRRVDGTVAVGVHVPARFVAVQDAVVV